MPVAKVGAGRSWVREAAQAPPTAYKATGLASAPARAVGRGGEGVARVRRKGLQPGPGRAWPEMGPAESGTLGCLVTGEADRCTPEGRQDRKCTEAHLSATAALFWLKPYSRVDSQDTVFLCESVITRLL